MKRILSNPYIGFLLISLFICQISCKDQKKAPPFPVDEHEYEQPETLDFTFSDFEKVKWERMDASKIKISSPKKYNWNKLSKQPFDINLSYPMQGEIEKKEFDWSKLPSSDFDLESLPVQNIEVVTKVLGTPTIVKAGNLVTTSNSARGVMSVDSNFGLPGVAYSCIADTNGMIWFGTGNGIARYDAQNLEIYGSEQGLYAVNVSDIFEDSKGRIWVHSGANKVSVIDFKANLIHEITDAVNGFNRHGMMEATDGTFWYAPLEGGYKILDFDKRTIRSFAVDQGLAGYFNIKVFQDKQGLIWLTTDKGVNILDIEAGKNILFDMTSGLLNDFVGNFYQDDKGAIWIPGGNGITILNSDKTEVSYIKTENSFNGSRDFSHVYQDSNGIYWFGTPNGIIYSFDLKKELIQKHQLSGLQNNWVYQIFKDDRGDIWVSIAQGGIFKLNNSSGRPANYGQEDGLTSGDIWATLEDQEGKIWIGSREGIDIFDPEEKLIKHLGVDEGLFDLSNTRLDIDSDGRIWASGRRNGLSIIDPENQSIKSIGFEPEVIGGRLVCFVEEKNGVYWFGTDAGEIIKSDLKKGSFENIVIDSTDSDFANNAMIQDAGGRIWIATLDSGIEIYDLENNTMSRLDTDSGLASSRMYAIAKDKNGNIWAAGQEGVSYIDLDHKRISNFTATQGLGANDVYAVKEYKGQIFLGTSNGLTILTPSKEESNVIIWEVKNIGQNQGLDLVDFAENSFSFDSNGRFWASLVESITVLDEIEKDSLEVPTYVTGINILDQKTIFRNLDSVGIELARYDSVWIQAKNRLRLMKQPEVDSMTISANEIEWGGVTQPYYMPTGLTLPYTQNYLNFTFNSTQFSNPDKVVYRYILEGIDKNWRPVTEKTTSENYRDLAPGDYTFKVASKGFNQDWSKPSEFSFTILPPWWQTWWAYTIFAALFLGLGLVILHYRSRWLKRENKILEEKVNIRTAKLKKTIDELESTQSQLIQSEKMASLGELTAGIAHEIQNPMNFINNFSEVTIELVEEMCEEIEKGDIAEVKDISKDITQNLEKITHHGKRASSIVKGMLEHSRNSSGKKELVDLNVLSDEYLRLAYHGLRAKDKSFNADFKTDFDETLPKVEIIPQDLGRVVLNIINNAFFAVTSIPESERPEGYQPTVKVTTKNMGNQAMISIKDNGPGIEKEIKDKIFQPFFTTKPTGKGTGLGLSLAYDIVTTGHGGAIELNTAPGEGTEFVIYIPIST